MGKNYGRMLILCIFDTPLLVFVCQITFPLPSIEMWAENDPEHNIHALIVLLLTNVS